MFEVSWGAVGVCDTVVAVGGVVVVVVVAVVVVVVSLPSDASRNSLMPLPSEPNTCGSLPAPKRISTITRIKSSSGGPKLTGFLLSCARAVFGRLRFMQTLYHRAAPAVYSGRIISRQDT